MYFGSTDRNATFVMDREEEEGQLKVVREDEGIHFERGYWNASACMLKNGIYAFETHNYREVHRYGLKSGKWRLYFQKSDLIPNE